MPTLVLVGERDLPYNHRIAERLATEISGAKLQVLQGVGHLSNMEAPAAFNHAVLSFLAEVPEN